MLEEVFLELVNGTRVPAPATPASSPVNDLPAPLAAAAAPVTTSPEDPEPGVEDAEYIHAVEDDPNDTVAAEEGDLR